MARRYRRVTLIHNAKAGAADHEGSVLVRLIERAGRQVKHFRYKHCDLAEALKRPADLVAIAGGDGTVAKVAAHCHPDGPPIAILPLGTANNLAKSLGIYGAPEDLIAGWAAGELRPFHPIDAEGPWGRRRLVEGLGLGAFAEALALLPRRPGFTGARTVFADLVTTALPERLAIRIGGETLDGGFVLLEAATIPLVGPNLPLAAAADPARRKFAVSFIGEDGDEREALARWIAAGGEGAAPVSFRTAAAATIEGRFRRVRLDGHLWEGSLADDTAARIVLSAEERPLHFLGP